MQVGHGIVDIVKGIWRGRGESLSWRRAGERPGGARTPVLRLGAALEEDRGTGIRKLLANGMRTCGGWRTRCRNGDTQGSRVHTVVIPRRCPFGKQVRLCFTSRPGAKEHCGRCCSWKVLWSKCETDHEVASTRLVVCLTTKSRPFVCLHFPARRGLPNHPAHLRV